MAQLDDDAARIADMSINPIAGQLIHDAAESETLSIELGLNEWGALIAALYVVRNGESFSLEGLRRLGPVYEKIKPQVDAAVEQVIATLRAES
jgi:hypothetical protein